MTAARTVDMEEEEHRIVWEEGAFVGLNAQLLIKFVTDFEEQVIWPVPSLRVQLHSALSPLQV